MEIAIITARGGSKRILRKNIRDFLGKPMIAWPIEAALASKCFDHVLASTEDEEIAKIARKYGAETPLMRPSELADDFTPAHKAARHMLEWALEHWGKIDSFAHIYPTAALLSPGDIRKARQMIADGANYVYAVRKIDFPIYQVVVRNRNGSVGNLFPHHKVAMRSQDMPDAFIDAGQLYFFKTGAFLENELEIRDGVKLLPLPRERAIDIDTEDDWRLAEIMAKMSMAKDIGANAQGALLD